MATSRESFDQGIHNEETCNYLVLGQKFPDWTITTAFYAALHFVTSKVFPFDHPVTGQPARKFNDIETWQKFKNYGSAKMHELLKDLVAKYCEPVSCQYEWLLSTSWNARYHSHQHQTEIVKLAVSYMQVIKNHCDPAKKKQQSKAK